MPALLLYLAHDHVTKPPTSNSQLVRTTNSCTTAINQATPSMAYAPPRWNGSVSAGCVLLSCCSSSCTASGSAIVSTGAGICMCFGGLVLYCMCSQTKIQANCIVFRGTAGCFGQQAQHPNTSLAAQPSHTTTHLLLDRVRAAAGRYWRRPGHDRGRHVRLVLVTACARAGQDVGHPGSEPCVVCARRDGRAHGGRRERHRWRGGGRVVFGAPLPRALIAAAGKPSCKRAG